MKSQEFSLSHLLLVSLGDNNYMKRSPNKTMYASKHYQVTIGIGKDHTATLTIDEESLNKLCEITGIDAEDLIEGE